MIFKQVIPFFFYLARKVIKKCW